MTNNYNTTENDVIIMLHLSLILIQFKLLDIFSLI